MRRILTAKIILMTILMGLGLAGCFFHFGPLILSPGRDRVLAEMQVGPADHLYIVAHRTPYVMEPYEVNLYRVRGRTNFFVCFLSSKDSYWWACSLRRTSNQDLVEIRSGLDGLKSLYSLTSGVVTSSHKMMNGSSTYRAEFVNWTVPDIVRQRENAVAHEGEVS